MTSGKQYNPLDEIFAHWSEVDTLEGRTVIDNFLNEAHLSDELKKEIESFIVSEYEARKSIPQLKRALRELFYERFQLKGGEVDMKTQLYVGSVKPINTYKHFLNQRYNDYFCNNQELLDRVVYNLDVYYNESEFREFLVNYSVCLVWVTWDEEDEKKDPFSFAPYRNPRKLCDLLGLRGSGYETGKLISFVFHFDDLKENNFILYRPTFCDADLNPGFKPSPKGSPYGRTKPLVSAYPEQGRLESVGRSQFVRLSKLNTKLTSP